MINQSGIPCGFINTGTIDNHIIGQDFLLMNSEITFLRLKSGMFRDKDINNLCTYANKLCSIPLYSYIKPNCSLEDCLEVTRTLIDEKQIQLLIIDDFDLFEELIDCKKEEYKINLEKIFHSLKSFARNNNISILLNMELDSVMGDSEPTVRAFKDKMIIPNFTDMVLFEYFEEKFTKEEYYEAKIIIAKDLNGNTEGMILPLKYYFSKGLFELKKEE